MKIQEKFTEAQYNDCLEKIKRKEYFNIEIKSGALRFVFSHEFCDNGCWKDNSNVSVYVYYGHSGLCYGMAIDKIESYYEICYRVNRIISGDRLDGFSREKAIKLSTIILIKKLLKDNVDKYLIRDLLLESVADKTK